jgi:hypothetical protein
MPVTADLLRKISPERLDIISRLLCRRAELARELSELSTKLLAASKEHDSVQWRAIYADATIVRRESNFLQDAFRFACAGSVRNELPGLNPVSNCYGYQGDLAADLIPREVQR